MSRTSRTDRAPSRNPVASAVPELPDLLAPEPTLRIDKRTARQVVVFAFAGGEGQDVGEVLLDSAKPCDSGFAPRQFLSGLFLDEFILQCFELPVGGARLQPHVGYVRAVLSHPPRDPAAVAFRREILAELARNPDLQADLAATTADLRQFFGLLASPSPGSFVELQHHRVAILRALRAALTGLSTRFDGARSGLSRLRRFGEELAGSPAFSHLQSLLDYEDGMATVDVRIRIGFDGDIRAFELLTLQEAGSNAFHRTAPGRLFTRIRLWLRGFRFGEFQVMAKLLDEVFTPFEEPICQLVQVMGDVEVYLGLLGFRDLARARGLEVCLPELAHPQGQGTVPRELHGLFNPLLLKGRAQPQPCDLVSARADTVVMITGPNSGGKTRLLQAVGLAQLLAQNGFFVPARAARLRWTEGLFLSLSQECQASQEEGRLGTELLRIRQLFEEVGPGDLAIIDELCSGTNPSEAVALIRLVLELLAELRPQVFVTTHFLAFAAELERSPPPTGMQFIQAAIDETNRPTYAFLPGVARTSLAAETAHRLGVTLDELVSLVDRKKALPRVDRELPASLGEGSAFPP